MSKKSYLKSLFDIPKYEIIVFILSCIFVVAGLAVLVTAFTLGVTTNWEHAFFKFLGLGSILTAVGAVFANTNFLLMHIRHHRNGYGIKKQGEKE